MGCWPEDIETNKTTKFNNEEPQITDENNTYKQRPSKDRYDNSSEYLLSSLKKIYQSRLKGDYLWTPHFRQGRSPCTVPFEYVSI
jgi:hypothetical protein